MKAVRPIIASNRICHLQMRSVGSHSTSGREKEGNKERTGNYDLDQSSSSPIILMGFSGHRFIPPRLLNTETH